MIIDGMIRADALHIPLADESVHCVVTSPPYWGLRDYGLDGKGIGLEATPEEYVSKIVAAFREVRRVLRGDGTVWLNLGDSFARDPGRGVKFEAGASTHLVNRQAEEGNRGPEVPPGLKEKDLVGIPWRVAFALQADGWYLRSDIIWAKPNPMPESVTDRPTRAHEYLFLLTKSPRYYYDAKAIKEQTADMETSPRKFRQSGAESTLRHDTGRDYQPRQFRNKRDVWIISTQPYQGAHFATFPEALVEPCVLASSSSGDVVLDPFCGSGTTGVVAKRLGRGFVGLDLSAEYLKLAKGRIYGITEGMPL